MMTPKTKIELGTRRLQQGAGAHVLNVPVVAVRALGLQPGDLMQWSIVDGVLQIEKENDAPQSADTAVVA